MKRTLFIAALLLCCVAAQAQTQFGIKGGFAASWIPGTVINGDEVVKPHNSFYLGGTASWELSDLFILQTELLYAGKGYSDRSRVRSEAGLYDKYSRTLGYLQLPVFAGISLSDRGYIMVGPEFGYLVYSHKDDYGVKSSGKEECNPFNLAAAVQATYMITDGLGLDLKFDWGLTKTFRGDYYGVENTGHNMSVQIGLCYMFDY